MTEIAPPPDSTIEEPAAPPEAPAPRVPEAPPAAAWVEAEAEARTLATALDEAARAAWTGWTAGVTAEVLRPLRTLVERLASVHRRHAEQAGFQAEAFDDDGVLWRQAVAYREAVAADVIAPLHEHLAQRSLASVLGSGCLNMVEPLVTLGASATSHRTLPRPFTLYAPAPSDGILRQVRKRFVRAHRGLQQMNLRLLNGLRRLFRLEPLPLPARGRLVPLRDLSAYHTEVRLPARLVPLHEGVQRHVATLVGRLETATTDWTHAVLDAEFRLDRIAFHQPAIFWSLAGAEGMPGEEVDPEVATAFASVAQALQQALEEIAEGLVFPDLNAEEALHAASDELEEDLDRAGTFLLNLKARRIPLPEGQPSAQIQARQQNWMAWHRQAVTRFRLLGYLTALRKDLLDLENTLLTRISDASLRPVLQAFRPVANHLREAEQQAGQVCTEAAEASDLEAAQGALKSLQEQTMEVLQEAMSDLPGLVSADQALAEPGGPEWATMGQLIEQLPEHLLLHALPRQGSALVPEKRPWRMEVRLNVKDILHPFAELLTEPAQPLRKQIVRIWGETEQIGHIVQYNLDVALDVLKGATPEAVPGETGDVEESKDPLQDARELATDGLRRAADTLMDLAKSLDAPWQTFSRAVFEMFEKDWADLHRGARTEALVEEQWYDFWIRARRQGQRLRRQAKELWQEYSKVAVRLFRQGRRRLQQLIEQGRSAIGTVEATEEDRLQTIDAISAANVRALQDRLPLVYRKLFSLTPVLEPSLLEGRQADLSRINQHFRRWKGGRAAGALVVPMSLGSGRTSLLNVVRSALQSQASVTTVTLRKRLYDASDFAGCLAEGLGIELEGEVSLETLEAYLLETPRSTPPPVCLIDNLEHLLLRTLGGSDLIERVLIFFSRTDTQVCWVATIGDYAWRFLEKTLGTATGLVATYSPASFDAAMLEAVIVNRHRRSGMVLRFAEPKDLSPLVRRRLNRAKTPEDQQEILRAIYFERLHRFSGQNVMLTLFYWLRSTDFKSEEGILTIQPVEPLSFRFFESFDLARAFTLKAFMLHHTLTLEEHNRIFRLNDDESTYLLESLLNLRLIEPCTPEARRDSSGGPSRIYADVRYRLHPLIHHPTYLLLKERNIIH